MKTLLVTAIICAGFYILGAQTPLVVPDTLSGQSFTLTMHEDSVAFFPGAKSRTYGYNQYPYLGPTLIFEKGEPISIQVENAIQDTTTVHWHGIHLPSKWDGGPHTVILPGSTWNPQFTVMDHAATYWYHPHMHMKTAEQAIKGAAGFIIVRDSQERALNLPRRYGIDDFPLVVQCQQYDSLNQAMPLGMQDSTLLVNGARANNDGYSVYADFPAQVVRLRFLNGSGERSFNFGFSGNLPFAQIASDGGLLGTPFDTTRLRLAPGERAEILLDLTGLQGQTLYLMSYASELPMGMQGGPTMPMPPGFPPMDSPLNGIDFNIIQINVAAQTPNPVTAIPTTLVPQTSYDTADAAITRTIRFTADSAMVMDGPFYFNDSTFNMDRIDFVIPINQVEIWKLVNETMVAHPFHIHDVQFYIVDRNDYSQPHPGEKGRKDVALIHTGDSLRFITKFEHFADSMIPYMYHCHILMHEDDGMMGQFTVVDPNAMGIQDAGGLTQKITVFPNPSSEEIEINLPRELTAFDLRIVDTQGRVLILANHRTQRTVNISALAPGAYYLFARSNRAYFSASFIKY